MFYEKHQQISHPEERSMEPQPGLGPQQGRTRSQSETEEIINEAENLRRRDEEDFNKRKEEARRRVENHLNQQGGDLSYLIREGIPVDVRCIQLTNWGSNNDYIKTARIPLPLPGKNEVLIKSYACGVLFQDILTRQGILDSWVRSLKLPFTMGSEVAGEVVGVGRNVTDLKPGDRVMALPERKAWSEYVTCKADYCFRLPDEMSYNDAVALTSDGIVSYALLFEMGGLRCEDPCGLSANRKNILMHSSAGGLSDMIMQMLRTVPNSRLFKIALPQEEGTGETWDESVHYIDRDADYVSEIRHVSPHGVDLVLDCQYEDNFNRDFNLLRPMGKYVLFGAHAAFNEGRGGFLQTAKSWWGADKISPMKLYEENKSVCGFNLRNLLYFQQDRQYVRELFCKVCKLWQDGKIKPNIDCVLQFEDFSEALNRMQEHSNQVCKIILNPLMTREEARHQRDYFLQAEKLVNERRKQKQAEKESLLPKFRLPGAGELAHDISPEEKAREAQEKREKELQENREALQKKLQEQQPSLGIQQPIIIPASAAYEIAPQPVVQPVVVAQAPPVAPVEVRPATGTVEPQIVYDSSTGRTVINEPSPYSVERVISDLRAAAAPIVTTPTPAVVQPPPSAASVIETMTTETPSEARSTSATTAENPPPPAVLTKEKVELAVPMSEKEAKELMKEAPSEITEPEKHTGIYEKLRETFFPHRGE